MNIVEKFFTKRFKGTKLTFDFGLQPIDTKALFSGTSIKVSGTKYWSGNIIDDKCTPITGKDCHIYIRTVYTGSIKSTNRVLDFKEFFSNLSIMTTTIGGFYSVDVDKLLVYSDLFIQDKSTIRNGKPLGKNYIHFKGKGKNGTEFEGYFTFSDAAVEDGFKKYISTIYSEIG